MNYIPTFVAILAPIINCVQLLPQLIKTIATKKVKDLSFASLLLILLTNLLWLTHGYFILDKSLMVAGIVSITINSLLLIFYMKYK